jgi:low affinity Fe/Cu permease
MKAKKNGHKSAAANGGGAVNSHHPNALSLMFSAFAQKTALWTGHPVAFLLAMLTIVVWVVSGPLFNYSDTWQLVINTGTTIVTFLMVFLIQNTQNRDMLAVQLKLSELVLAMKGAKNSYAAIEDLTDEELEELHNDCRMRAEMTGQHLEVRRGTVKTTKVMTAKKRPRPGTIVPCRRYVEHRGSVSHADFARAGSVVDVPQVKVQGERDAKNHDRFGRGIGPGWLSDRPARPCADRRSDRRRRGHRDRRGNGRRQWSSSGRPHRRRCRRRHRRSHCAIGLRISHPFGPSAPLLEIGNRGSGERSPGFAIKLAFFSNQGRVGFADRGWT